MNRDHGEAHDSDAGLRPALFSVGEWFGGVERQLLDLCTYGRRKGRDPELILFHDLELASQARARGFTPIILQNRHRYDSRASRQLAAVIADRKVDVLHVHGYKAMVTAALVRRAVLSRGTPRPLCIVKTEHGKPEPVGGSVITWSKSRLNYTLGLLATRHSADVVTYVTKDIATHFSRTHGSLARVIVHNGIDPLDRRSCQRPAEFDADVREIGIVGRLTPVKGVSFALRAMASSDLPAGIRLNIIGEGPAEPALREEATALGLGERVRFLGFRRNVLEYIAHLDALLMPSLYEGLPYTLLEGMSLGTPIIASAVGGLREVLRDGVTAILAPARDSHGLAAAIGRICSDRAMACAIGQSGAALQRSAFTLTHMGDQYWDIYRTYAAARGREHASTC